MTARPTLLALGLAGMLACSSDQPTTAPDSPDHNVQSSSTPLTLKFRPTIDGFIRDGNTLVDNGVVQTLHNPRIEDRGVLEFGLGGFSGPVLKATLRLTVFGSKGPFPFRVDLYGYRGNGSFDLADWDRGTFISSFQYAGEATLALDVTTKVQALKSTGAKYAGFNFRAEKSDIEMNSPFVAFNSNEFPPRAVLAIKTETP